MSKSFLKIYMKIISVYWLYPGFELFLSRLEDNSLGLNTVSSSLHFALVLDLKTRTDMICQRLPREGDLAGRKDTGRGHMSKKAAWALSRQTFLCWHQLSSSHLPHDQNTRYHSLTGAMQGSSWESHAQWNLRIPRAWNNSMTPKKVGEGVLSA